MVSKSAHTSCIKLLQQLVMLTTQLGPSRKLVLATGSVQLASFLEIFGLKPALLSGSFGRRYREEVDQGPYLITKVSRCHVLKT